MQTCSCGATLADDAKFCPACGAKRAAALSTCPTCGAAAEPGARFCTACGTALTAVSPPAPLPPPAPKPAPHPAPQPRVAGGDKRPAKAGRGERMLALQRGEEMKTTAAAAALIWAIVLAGVAWGVFRNDPAILQMQMIVAGLYALCAAGIWFGFGLAALAGLVLCAADLWLGLKNSGGIGPLLHMLPGGVMLPIFRWIVLPIVLFRGYRGCEMQSAYLAEVRAKAKAEADAKAAVGGG